MIEIEYHKSKQRCQNEKDNPKYLSIEWNFGFVKLIDGN
jgi:hypothetical protein